VAGVSGATLHRATAPDGTSIAWRAHPASADAADRASFVLTNGLSTTDNFWKPLTSELAPAHRVFDWWYRGHGESEPSRSSEYSIARHADDLRLVTEAVLATEGGTPPPVHVAFSMGVTVLLELYRARPDLVRAMVLVAGGADHPYASSALMRIPLARAAVRGTLRAASPLVPALSPLARRVAASKALFPLARSLGAIGEGAPREEVEHFFRGVGSMDLRAYWETLRSLMDARASDVLPHIRVPVLVVAPERDVMALRGDLDALRDAIPDAEWLDLPRTSHAILLEAGSTIAARVRAFAASLV
jgi:pimeloyl-ACP methyl ester carboxylesterase